MLLIACASVQTQYAMPYQMQQQYQFPGPPRPPPPSIPMPPPPIPMPPPPMPMPPPIPMPPPYPPSMGIAQSMMAVPAGYAVIIPEDFGRGKHRKSTTTTTTTTTRRPPTRPFRIIPIQMMPPPMIPAPMPPSPMMPGPMMMQGPPMMMPSPMMLLNYPSNSRRRRRKQWGGRHSGSSSSTSSSSSSRETSCESLRVKADSEIKKRWNTVTRRNNLRAYNRVPDVGVVKPVLSYVAPNGDVKFETKITNREAVNLLNDKDASIDFENDSLNHHEEPRKNVRVVTKRDKNNEQLVVYTEDEPAGSRSYRRSFHRVAVGSKPVQQYLQKGKKELIFNAPENKKITNMTLSFQVV